MSKAKTKKSSDRPQFGPGENVLLKYVEDDKSWTLDFYKKHKGYDGARKALDMEPGEITEMVRTRAHSNRDAGA